MTDEDHSLSEGEESYDGIDWSVAEFAANHGGSTEGAPVSEGVGVTVLSQDMLTRRLLWDTVPCDIAVETAKFLGLPDVSDDVEDMEHTQAHQRLTDVGVLLPIVMAVSLSATQAIVASMFVADDAVHLDVNSSEFIDTVEKMQPLIYAASAATLAELLNIGLVHTPHFMAFNPDEDTFTVDDVEE